MSKKGIAILGSTGKVGKTTLSVIKRFPDQFEVELLTANDNYELLIEQALEFRPNQVVIVNDDYYEKVQDVLWDNDIKVYSGKDALCQIIDMPSIHLVVNALKGMEGVRLSLESIKASKVLALANRETMNTAGSLVTKLAQSKGVNIFPIDPLQSSIFQSLVGDFDNRPENVGVLISHDTERWNLASILIQAKWLFGIKAEHLSVMIHPEQVLSSVVEFSDGTMKTQLFSNDLGKSIQYALTYPKRLKSNEKQSSLLQNSSMNFSKPDTLTLKIIDLVKSTMEKGGNAECVVYAAIETMINSNLPNHADFNQMMDNVESCLQKVNFVANPSYDDLVATEKATRQLVKRLIK